MNKLTAIFAGSGIGALLGILIGMSVSNTVSVVIGSITSILVILLGIQDKENRDLHALRVGAFGVVCAICCLLGVYLRANNALSPSIAEQVKLWTTDSLFSIEESKRFVLYEKLGIISPGLKLDSLKGNNAQNSVLYGAMVSEDICSRLDTYEKYTLTEELQAYRLEGGSWKDIADSVSASVSEPQQKKILHLIKNCLCDAK